MIGKISLVTAVVVLYVVSLNTASFLAYRSDIVIEKPDSSLVEGSAVSTEKVGVGESLTVSVTRKMFYGRIYELQGATGEKRSTLLLLWLIPIPLHIRHLSLKWVHWGFSVLVLVLIAVLCYKEIREHQNQARIIRGWKLHEEMAKNNSFDNRGNSFCSYDD